jgi:hypothetical protein
MDWAAEKKKPCIATGLDLLVPLDGLELSTYRLQV